MKIHFAEAGHVYASYLFPYQVVGIKEKEDDIAAIYNCGFLPFRHLLNTFYLSRSSRCRLADFKLSSENRRILRKTEDLTVEKKNLHDFEFTFSVQKQCKTWARQKGWRISSASLRHIFSGSFFNQLWSWFEKGKSTPIGYQIIFTHQHFIHTAYVFYDQEYHSLGLGNRMLLEASLYGREKGLSFHYLGTAYGGTGYYKRNLSGFEFFNGSGWSANLKEWEHLDHLQKGNYLWRDQKYLVDFRKGNLESLLGEGGVAVKIK